MAVYKEATGPDKHLKSRMLWFGMGGMEARVGRGDKPVATL